MLKGKLSCRAFVSNFEWGGNIKRRTTGPVMFFSLRSNVISVFCLKDICLGWGNGFECEGKYIGTGGLLLLSKFVEKALYFKTTTGFV